MSKHLIVIATAMVWFAGTIFAQPVDMKTIERVAINAYSELAIETGRVLLDKIAITEVIPVKDGAENLLYCIVNIMDSGFTIVSADKMMIPVLGRSLKGKFSFDKAPPGLLYLLEKYKHEVVIARKSGIEKNEKTDALWCKYNVEFEKFTTPKSAKSVTPLLSTEWGQRGGFNRFCPPFGGETRYPAGCVAVAMAQVLNYWACRVNETGSNSYWWKPSPISLDSTLLEANFGEANYQWAQMHPTLSNDHNALLIYHAGVACEMDYGENGSSSVPSRARDGLRDYYGISNSIDTKWRIWWTISSWRNLLQGQLDSGNPIIYSGGSLSGGHSWVIDGYDSNGAFHCNWGWQGWQDGYYYLGSFDTENGSFNMVESAIVNIIPTRKVEVGQPVLSDTSVYAGVSQLSIAPVVPATSYEWTTTHGTIVGTGTTATLNTQTCTEVCVRALNERCEVASAWNCANIGMLPGYISGPTTVCNTNTTFTLNNLPAGCTVSWSHSSNLSYEGSTSGSVTVRAKSALYSGPGWVEATVSGPCGATPPVRHTVWVGTPLAPLTLWNIFDGEMFEDNTQYTFRVDPAPLGQGVYQTSWSVSGAASIVSGANSLNVWVLTDDTHYNSFTVSAAYTNGCGTGLTTSATGYIQGAIGPGDIIVEGMYSVYPNPVGSEVTIATLAEADRKAGEDKRVLPQPIQRIRIYDRAGNLKRSRSYPVSERVTLNVSDLPRGTYLIQINDLPAHPIVKQ